MNVPNHPQLKLRQVKGQAANETLHFARYIVKVPRHAQAIFHFQPAIARGGCFV
jgi:hypothetical protein